MDWLADYDSKETEESDKFLLTVYDNKISSDYRYPFPGRFKKLQFPASQAFYLDIWAQIPLYGSSFVIVPPLPKDQFLFQFGFEDIKQFYDLVDFHKETGRIQFILNSSPKRYAECDFLESFLRR